MIGYTVKRLIFMIPLLLGITIICFVVMHLAPGAPTDLETQMNPRVSAEMKERLRAMYDLDKPLPEQYLIWLNKLVRLDLGVSFSSDRRPVADKILERLPITIALNILSMIMILMVAIPIGVLSAVHQNSFFDRITGVFVFIGFAIPTFWLALGLLVPLEVVSLVLYVKAIKLSPLSLSVPFLALSPVFIIFIAYFVLGEVPTRGGVAGVCLIAVGAYLLNASASRFGLLGPIKAIAREPGSMLMIVVSIVYSVTATIGKVAIEHSGPVFFGFFYPFVLTMVLSLVLLRKGRLRGVFSRPVTFLPIGLCTAIMIVSHFVALGMTQVAYLVSVKRTSLVFSVLYGSLLFKEVNIRERLLGGVVMVAGVVLVAVF